MRQEVRKQIEKEVSVLLSDASQICCSVEACERVCGGGAGGGRPGAGGVAESFSEEAVLELDPE